jgi:hypothetical protein
MPKLSWEPKPSIDSAREGLYKGAAAGGSECGEGVSNVG